MSDSFWQNVAVSLPLDGSAVDVSDNALTVTVNGSPTYGNADGPFGEDSIAFIAAGSAITLPSDPVLDAGTGPYTIEAFVFAPSTLVGFWDQRLSDANGMALYDTSGAGGPVTPAVFINGADRLVGGTQASGVWFHLMQTRDASGVTRLFIDGVKQEAEYTDTRAYDFSQFIIGDLQTYGVVGPYMQHFRLTIGVARETDTFTPPTGPHPTTGPVVGPTITAQPSSVLVDEDSPASFTVTATGTGALTYQWYDASDDSAIVGETSSTYSLTAEASLKGAQFYCIVTDDNGSTQTDTVTLNINIIVKVALHLPFQSDLLDAGEEAHTVTVSGAPSIVSQSQYAGPGGPYNAAAFDGVDDYLTIADHPSFTAGSRDMTLELWVRLPSGTGTSSGCLVQHGDLTSVFGTSIGAWAIWWRSGVGFRISLSSDGSSIDIPGFGRLVASSGSVGSNWNHIAITRQGDTWRWFFNGALVGSTTDAKSVYDDPGAVTVAAGQGGVIPLECEIIDLRFATGIATYTQAFTPNDVPLPLFDDLTEVIVSMPSPLAAPALLVATDPVVVDSLFPQVVTLQHFDGSFVQIRSAVELSQVFNPTIDNAVSRFGGGSALFQNNAHQEGDGFDWQSDWTLECFAYVDALGAVAWIIDTRADATDQSGWELRINDGTLQFVYFRELFGWTLLSAPTAITAQTWHHIALVHEGDEYRMYLDGALEGSITETLALTSTAGRFGADTALSAGAIRLDELRVTQAARSIVVPAAPYPDSDALQLNITAALQFASPLAPPAIVAQSTGVIVSMPSPLAPPAVVVENDFTVLIPPGSVIRYTLRISGTPEIVVPISSWQATLQTGRQSYVQCVVPAYTDFADDIASRVGETFTISRVTEAPFGLVESAMAAAPLQTIVTNRGAQNETATLSGYSDQFKDQGGSGTRTLKNVRGSSTSTGGATRATADIDWLLRPGQTVIADDLSFVADYINYFSPLDTPESMIVGSRG